MDDKTRTEKLRKIVDVLEDGQLKSAMQLLDELEEFTDKTALQYILLRKIEFLIINTWSEETTVEEIMRFEKPLVKVIGIKSNGIITSGGEILEHYEVYKIMGWTPEEVYDMLCRTELKLLGQDVEPYQLDDRLNTLRKSRIIKNLLNNENEN
jgi:hypothetical protein